MARAEEAQPEGTRGRRPVALVVEDDRSYRDLLALILRPHARVLTAESGPEALEHARNSRIDVAFLDLGLPGDLDGLQVMAELRSLQPHVEVIISTAERAIQTVVQAIKAGAFDYVVKDFAALQEAPLLLERALERGRERRELAFLRSELEDAGEIAGAENEPMRSVLETLGRAARTQSTVLLLGESGTGKELLARRLHRLSDRAGGPFVVVNVAGIKPELIETTLFGHTRGAFTGAVESVAGRFELADGGTLFLDEVGDLDRSLQPKVLRVLQERQLERVGGQEPIEVDVRIVAATHVDLREAVARGHFREDLFYRLNVIPIRVPPLRERIADLPELVDSLLRSKARKLRRQPPVFAPETLGALSSYGWRGNIRELENLVERMFVLAPGPVIQPTDLPIEYRVDRIAAEAQATPGADGLAAACEAFEKALVAGALARAGGNRSAAARALGVPFSTLRYKIEKYGLG